MPRIQFDRDPAWVTIGEGISLALEHWRATAVWWAIPVLVLGLLSGVMTAMTVAAVEAIPPDTFIRGAEIDWAELFGAVVPQFVSTVVVVSIVGLLAQWVYLGLVVTGLRGGELQAGWVVARGLRVLGADILSTLAVVATGAVVVFLVVTMQGLGVLLGLVAFVAWLLVVIRLAFWRFAIFDGAGIGEGLSRSLRLTSGSWLRLIGWWLAAVGIGILISIPFAILGGVLSELPAISAGLRTTVQEAYAVFQLFLLGVLYESQRRRLMPAPDEPPVAARPYAPAPAPEWGPAYAPAPGSAVDPLGRPLPPPGAGEAGAAPPAPPTAPPAPPAPPVDPWRG